ncbi:MAG TPA: glycosyltransferase [Peptococcaceae bacterium]|nr:glycosyltransferase [Peptococcaceae bacterium]
MRRIVLLGAPVDAVTLEEAVERAAAFIREGGPHQVLTLNPEYLYRALREPHLMEIVRRAALVTADGVGIVWAARMLGQPVPERVTGIDLMTALAARAAREGWRVFLLGASPGVAEAAAAKLAARFPGFQVAGAHHGYFAPEDEPKLLQRINAARPDVLFVALGAPKQEVWIARNLNTLRVPVVMGVGGSFDVLAGRVKRAPAVLRRLHLEWLGRLVYEPRRWRRMLVLPKFVWTVLVERLRGVLCRRK